MVPYFNFLNFCQLWRAILEQNFIFMKEPETMLNNFLLEIGNGETQDSEFHINFDAFLSFHNICLGIREALEIFTAWESEFHINLFKFFSSLSICLESSVNFENLKKS